jgi:hypothetical protein
MNVQTWNSLFQDKENKKKDKLAKMEKDEKEHSK